MSVSLALTTGFMSLAALPASFMRTLKTLPSFTIRRQIAGNGFRLSVRAAVPSAPSRSREGFDVFGGRSHDPAPLNVHDVYDPATDRWTEKAPMPIARDHMGIAVIDGKIHIIGGRTGGQTDNVGQHDVYDPATDKWSKAAPIPTPRSGGAAVYYNGLLIYAGGECKKVDPNAAFGGGEDFDEVEGYDPKTNVWKSLTKLPGARQAFGAATVGSGRLFSRWHNALWRSRTDGSDARTPIKVKLFVRTMRRGLLFISPIMPDDQGNGLAMRAGVALQALSRSFDVHLGLVPVAGGSDSPSPLTRRHAASIQSLPLAEYLDPYYALIERIVDPEARRRARLTYPKPYLSRFCTGQSGGGCCRVVHRQGHCCHSPHAPLSCAPGEKNGRGLPCP